MSSTSSSNPMLTPTLIKSAAVFGLSVAVDKFIFKNDNMTQSAIYAAANTASLIGGEMIAQKAITSGFMPDQAGLYTGKLISQRLLEVSTGVAGGYILNRFVLKNDYNGNDFLKRLGAIAVIDVLAEYTKDYVLGTTVGYLLD